MKKKLALMLAAVMVAGLVPATTAMAAAKNQVTKTVSVTTDTYLGTLTSGTYSYENNLVITEQDGFTRNSGTSMTFQLTLDGASWLAKDANGDDLSTDDVEALLKDGEIVKTISGVPTTVATGDPITVTGTLPTAITDAENGTGEFVVTDVQKLTSTILTVTVQAQDGEGQPVNLAGAKPKIIVPLYTKVTGSDEAKIEVDPLSSELKAETLTFAYIVTGATTSTIESLTKVTGTPTTIKPIIIKENVAGTLTDNKDLTLKLYGDFEFANNEDDIIVSEATGSHNWTNNSYDVEYKDSQKIVIHIYDNAFVANKKAQLVISGLMVGSTDDVENGEKAEIYISGAGVTSETLEVAQYVDYGVTVTAEDKDLPVIYAGTDNDTKTLKVTLKEDIADSWLSNRKTSFTFPSGIKIKQFIVTKNSKISNVGAIAYDPAGLSGIAKWTTTNNVLTLTGITKTGAATFTVQFVLLADPSFTGDVTCTVGGAALQEDTELTIATVKPILTVETAVNEVIIDYRRTAVNDLVINETAAGLFKKDKDLYLNAEMMSFEDGAKYEITAGDIKLTDVKVSSAGTITVDVKSESVKTPASIKLSNLSLYMNRSLAAGDYKLYTVTGSNLGSNFATYASDETYTKFETDEVTLLDNYVTIVTAGRDQDDSTFTTNVKVTIGANTMTAGTKTIELDAPAYISNGYTMLPVRAVAEALSGSAQVTWDDATKTVVIFFGSRIIKITIGSKDMIINGTATSMLAPAEITNSRTFISLRDLGYALGLNDDKIQWDDATKTASLN